MYHPLTIYLLYSPISIQHSAHLLSLPGTEAETGAIYSCCFQSNPVREKQEAGQASLCVCLYKGIEPRSRVSL